MNDSEKWNAIRTNDKRYDGKFYYGDNSTCVFCRPSCPTKLPNQKNVVFFNNAKEAKENGFQPCKLCRPDLAKHDPTSDLATFFKKHVGVSSSEYARKQISEYLYRYVKTPIGMIRIEEDSYGISSLSFVDGSEVLTNRELSCLYLDDTETQLLEYFEGKRRTFDIPLSVSGSDFQKRVWKALQEIPYGETRSYQQIAAAIGNTNAARAVGMANNRNPISIIIPCHRVVGKTGKLVGYAGGIERKQYLLEMEAKRK